MSKKAFKNEIRKDSNPLLRMQQLCNEYPEHVIIITQAAAEVIAEGVAL